MRDLRNEKCAVISSFVFLAVWKLSNWKSNIDKLSENEYICYFLDTRKRIFSEKKFSFRSKSKLLFFTKLPVSLKYRRNVEGERKQRSLTQNMKLFWDLNADLSHNFSSLRLTENPLKHTWYWSANRRLWLIAYSHVNFNYLNVAHKVN
jgi:hypothetical protein